MFGHGGKLLLTMTARTRRRRAMLARIQAARENESGFTLIELLIVIVILGVLSGIVVFSVSGITSRGAAAACKSDLASIQVATEAYYAQKTSYPTAVDDAGHTATTLVGAKFLKAAPSGETFAISQVAVGTVPAGTVTVASVAGVAATVCPVS
jgi:prepilin-type N-terminal cleavage/methylation domain-containing protein